MWPFGKRFCVSGKGICVQGKVLDGFWLFLAGEVTFWLDFGVGGVYKVANFCTMRRSRRCSSSGFIFIFCYI